MSTREDHERLLRKGPFPIPETRGLTDRERQVLVETGYWLDALASGRLIPMTVAQEQFVAVANGQAVAQSLHERAWVKLRPPSATPPMKRAKPKRARLSPADEAVLRQLRGMVTRREVVSSFAESVLQQWEESGAVTPRQLTAVRRLVGRTAARTSMPRTVGGGGRKPGSHRSARE